MVDGQVVETYRRDGVVGIPGLLSGDDVARVRSAIARYVAEVAPGVPAGDVVFEADGVSVRNLWRMEFHDAFFAELGNRPSIVSAISALVGGAVELAAVETFNKPALHGSGVPQHQDNAYFCQTPPDMCTVWIAVDAATPENGSVRYARGTADTLLPHKASGIPGNSMVMTELRTYPDAEVTTAVLDPGDAMVHHCQTVHWSTANLTDRPRCGLLLVYRATHTTTDPALKELYRRAQAS
jgi:ectoine hydroxylase-related dioxygenase (phytanoyl-CoA dioxygenase family)